MFSNNKQRPKKQSPRFKERFKGRTSVMPMQGFTQLARQQSLPIEKTAASPQSKSKKYKGMNNQPIRAYQHYKKPQSMRQSSHQKNSYLQEIMQPSTGIRPRKLRSQSLDRIARPIYRKIEFDESKRSKFSLPAKERADIDFDVRSIQSAHNPLDNNSAIFLSKSSKPKFTQFLNQIYTPQLQNQKQLKNQKYNQNNDYRPKIQRPQRQQPYQNDYATKSWMRSQNIRLTNKQKNYSQSMQQNYSQNYYQQPSVQYVQYVQQPIIPQRSYIKMANPQYQQPNFVSQLGQGYQEQNPPPKYNPDLNKFIAQTTGTQKQGQKRRKVKIKQGKRTRNKRTTLANNAYNIMMGTNKPDKQARFGIKKRKKQKK